MIIMRLIPILLLALLCGCTTSRPIVTTERASLHLDTAQLVRTAWGFGDTNVTLPPGAYVARYEDENGVFYAPVGAVQIHGRTVADSTVLVKNDRAVGLWLDGSKVIYPLSPSVQMTRSK